MASFNAWMSAAVTGGGAGAEAGEPLAGASFDADSVCAAAPEVSAARISAVRNRFLLDFMEVDFLLLDSAFLDSVFAATLFASDLTSMCIKACP